jgi:MFS family permease
VIFAVSTPLSFVVPYFAARMASQRAIALVLGLFFAAGFGGMIFAPVSLAFLWATLIGIGMAAFPLVLTMIGLRGGTPTGTAALSAFSQSAGYLIAAIGPLTFGLIGHTLGSWKVPLAAMAGVALVQGVVAAYVGSPKRGTLAAELEVAPVAEGDGPAGIAEASGMPGGMSGGASGGISGGMSGLELEASGAAEISAAELATTKFATAEFATSDSTGSTGAIGRSATPATPEPSGP